MRSGELALWRIFGGVRIFSGFFRVFNVIFYVSNDVIFLAASIRAFSWVAHPDGKKTDLPNGRHRFGFVCSRR
jgi:hypothetical protein